MDDLIRRQDAVKSMTNAIWHYPNEMYAQLNSYEMAEALAKDGLMFIPSAQTEQVKYVPDTKAIPSSRDCVDLSERVTATFYDVEHEEWSQKTVTIQDVLDSVCDEYTVLPSAQQWIPCSERLPEDDETVLVTKDNGIIEKATFEVGEVNNGWWMDFWYSEDNVKAWMPLPSPYKGENE